VGWRFVDFDALSESDLEAWGRIRTADSSFDSPFFHPRFAGAVHAVFGDVQVARIDDDPRVWFPLQIHRGFARPAGSPGSDFQGPVAAAGLTVDPLALLRDTGLRVLQFDSLSDPRADFQPWVRLQEQSPVIDTTGGLDGYVTRLGKSGRDKLSRVRRMTNKAARQLGEVRLVWDTLDPALLDHLIGIKLTQCRSTGAFEYFASPRRRALAHRLAETKTEDFSGVLSAVYAGDTLLAAHMGLRAGGVLHWWFPAYNRDHAELAPGWILLRELIAAAPSNGITRLDLGRGDEDYKRRAMTGAVSVCRGEVVGNPWRRQARMTQHNAVRRLKSSRLGSPLAAAKNRALGIIDSRV
jgi:CelD/BcsL family acetyltransferase involved in cellulose biosynthesis